MSERFASSAVNFSATRGTRLENLSWDQAEEKLKGHSLVMLPIGSQLKEHGLHLPLNTDWIMAEYLCTRVLERMPILAGPTVNFGYYPSFVEYPVSVNISKAVWREYLRDICASFASFGLKKIYFLNTGISTNWVLEPLRADLAAQGIVMEYADIGIIVDDIEKKIARQERGSHADEIETSMLLYIAPEKVQMSRAVREMAPREKGGRLVRDAARADQGIYSATGAWGDPTLASYEKGRILVEATVERVCAFLADFARAEYVPAPARQQYL